MANLLIDIGNTALKACWADGITLGKTYRYQGEKIMDFILTITEKEKPEIMVVSTVREINKRNESTLKRECGKLILIDSMHTQILEEENIPTYLRADRAASIVASRFIFKGKPCTIFDFGTTLSVDFIDADGNYMGGNVSPGCRTRFKSLNRYGSLPLVDMPSDTEEKGFSIKSSVEAGVISGIMFEICGYADKSPANLVVFTGGDAIYFAKRMKNSIFVVCNLVLMGLAIIAVKYV